jgi:hypothetical protein
LIRRGRAGDDRRGHAALHGLMTTAITQSLDTPSNGYLCWADVAGGGLQWFLSRSPKAPQREKSGNISVMDSIIVAPDFNLEKVELPQRKGG